MMFVIGMIIMFVPIAIAFWIGMCELSHHSNIMTNKLAVVLGSFIVIGAIIFIAGIINFMEVWG